MNVLQLKRAAAKNLTRDFFGNLESEGINIVAVQLNTMPGSPVHDHPELEKCLGLELEQVGAGRFHSRFDLGAPNSPEAASVWFFYHCAELAKAMARLKQQLGARGLLPISHILHGERDSQWRVWWSYDPESVGKLVEVPV